MSNIVEWRCERCHRAVGGTPSRLGAVRCKLCGRLVCSRCLAPLGILRGSGIVCRDCATTGAPRRDPRGDI